LVILGVGGYLVMEKQLSVGTLVAFVGLLPALFKPVEALVAVSQAVQAASGALRRIMEVLDEPVTIQEKAGARDLPPLTAEIRLEGVSAGYGGGRAVLRDLSLTIPAGTHVALVGPSGSGKSTLLNLLVRFWDTEQGRVLIDGHDIREVTLRSLRDQIGIVFQDAIVFEETIRANIAIGRQDATDAEIETAAQAARLDDVVAAFPDGYDTVLGERGVRLSGGQRQRLSLARVYLRRPRILVLDEATSALDTRTEKEILETLAHLIEGATTINITHRLRLADMADTVVVLDQGRIVEQGPPALLRHTGGLYQRLYEEQMSLPADDRGRVGAEEARLRAIPLFAGLSDAALAELARQLGRERVPAGRDVVRQGDAGDTFYIIARGHVDIFVRDERGGDGERRIDALDEGDYFGEMALLAGAPRNATARATVPTEVITLGRDAFLSLVERHPELQPSIDLKVAERRANLGWTTMESPPAPAAPSSGDRTS
jgi:ATP-binding cassette subfamily B protein